MKLNSNNIQIQYFHTNLTTINNLNSTTILLYYPNNNHRKSLKKMPNKINDFYNIRVFSQFF